jgi:predicted ATPase/DNA-binding winged helix-turn-helix (wHTH) protein
VRVILRLGDGLDLDDGLFELRRDGVVVRIEPQVFDVLVHLVRNRDRVVPKEELMDAVWGGRFVSEATVTGRIKQVRQALGDDGRSQHAVRTHHGRGYRFVLPVTEVARVAEVAEVAQVAEQVPTPAAPVVVAAAQAAPAAAPAAHVAGLRFGVLGPLVVTRDGDAVDLAGPLQRAVLAALVAADGRPVSDASLMAEVWGQPGSSTTALRTYLSRLRRSLGPDSTDGPIVREGGGYALRVPDADVDARAFLARVAEAERAEAAGDDAAAAAVLREALGLWRGDAYADVVPGPRLAATIAHLEHARLAATELLLDLRLRLGESAALVGELEAHVLRHPTSEHGWGLLATALYRAGRQADALGALTRARRQLVDEYGLDPGPELRRVEDAVLQQTLDQETPRAPQQPTVPAPAPVVDAQLGFLPAVPATALVGRADELGRVAGLSRGQRVVTLLGAGGSGKTRLALELLHAEHAETTWVGAFVSWVGLAEVHDPHLVPQAVADALGVTTLGTRATAEELVPLLRGREALVVLDNCEHLTDAVAATVETLVAGCPRLRFIATTREELRVSGEHIVDVGPLPLQAGDAASEGDAVRLFRLRAEQHGTRAVTPDDLATVQRICRGLDGNALAIELAAARCRTMTLTEVETALQNRFAVLTNGPRAGLAHHRTLRETVAWSYDLLTPEEQLAFRRLAVFDQFHLDDAVRLLGTGRGSSAMHVVHELAAKSLLVVDRTRSVARWTMLETLRLFATETASPDEWAETSARHLAWVDDLTAAAEPHLRGAEAATWINRLSLEQGNVRRALGWAFEHDPERALRVVPRLYWYWYRRGHSAEGQAWLERALPLAEERGVRARLLDGIGLLAYLNGDVVRGQQALEQAMGAVEGTGDAALESVILGHLGWFRAGAGDLPGGIEVARAGLEVAERAGLPAAESEALMTLGQLMRFVDLEEADQVLAASMDKGFAHDAQWVALCSGWIAAKVALSTDRPVRAVELSQRVVTALVGQADATGPVAALQTAAAAVAAAGDRIRAARLLGAVDATGERIGYSPQRMEPADSAWYRELIGDVVGDPDLATAYKEGRELTMVEAVRDLAAFDPAAAS